MMSKVYFKYYIKQNSKVHVANASNCLFFGDGYTVFIILYYRDYDKSNEIENYHLGLAV